MSFPGFSRVLRRRPSHVLVALRRAALAGAAAAAAARAGDAGASDGRRGTEGALQSGRGQTTDGAARLAREQRLASTAPGGCRKRFCQKNGNADLEVRDLVRDVSDGSSGTWPADVLTDRRPALLGRREERRHVVRAAAERDAEHARAGLGWLSRAGPVGRVFVYGPESLGKTPPPACGGGAAPISERRKAC